MARSPRSIVLRVRVTPSERQRLEAAASAEHVSVDLWAARAVLSELERAKSVMTAERARRASARERGEKPRGTRKAPRKRPARKRSDGR